MAAKLTLTEEEMVVDEGLGYPKAYAKLCGNASHFNPYNPGPPVEFIPCALPAQEAARAKELGKIFPVIDPEATPSVDPNGFVNLLWKQLSHLGNAGFDPALFRVDPFGNVLYFHADPASPLFWRIDHWFPCSRGGRTVPSNLRLLQWQVFRKKHNKLEFLIPWWDLQLGIPVNQFLHIFASKNSDFRNRAFSFLFMEGGNEELNELEVVYSHTFPPHYVELKQQVGLAPAAIVLSQRQHNTSVLKTHRMRHRSSLGEDDYEGLSRSIHGLRPSVSKEYDNLNIVGSGSSPYVSITLARDSLRQHEEGKKMQAEIIELENELNVLKQKNDTERIALQDLETLLIKKRRRVEKCRRLAESQSSYKALLEKMIRDAMHQSVVYKEQVRLNQAATSALMARLEAQRAICDASEKELHRRCKQKDDIEKRIVPCWEQTRKRSRMDSIFDEKHLERMEAIFDERHDETIHPFLASRTTIVPSIKKELRQFLEEEQKASEAGISLDYEQGQDAEEEPKNATNVERDLEYKVSTSAKNEILADNKLKKSALEFGSCSKTNARKTQSVPSNPRVEDDEEDSAQLGKRNVDRWVQMLLENAKEGSSSSASPPNRTGSENHTEEIVHELNLANPHEEIKFLRLKPSETRETCDQNRKEFEKRNSKDDMGTGSIKSKKVPDERNNSATNRKVLEERNSMADARTSCASEDISSSKNIEWNEMEWKKGRKIAKSDNARYFKSLPSSPQMILGMKRSMDCTKKPLVMGDDDNCNSHVDENNKAIRKRTMKRAVK